MRTTQRVLIAVSVSIIAFAAADVAFADCEECLPTFVQVPDYIVTGDGTCRHGGLGV